MALTDSLISYWELDEAIASGNRSDAHGSNLLTDLGGCGFATGKVSNAANFERDDLADALSHTDNTDLSTGDIDFTLCGWWYLESKPGANMSAISKSGPSHGAYFLGHVNSSDRLGFTIVGGAGYTNITAVEASTLGAPATVTWYFVVCWHDATANTINIQVNDGTVDSTSHTTGCYDDDGPFQIGGDAFGGFWDGLIDQVGFWKRTLTSGERSTLYNGGSGLSYAALVAGGGAATRGTVFGDGGTAFAGGRTWRGILA